MRYAALVFCRSCKTVVWAYDHLTEGGRDVRGIANMFRLTCPRCGDVANFDGVSLSDKMLMEWMKIEESKVYDYWSALKLWADAKGLVWAPSGDNSWK